MIARRHAAVRAATSLGGARASSSVSLALLAAGVLQAVPSAAADIAPSGVSSSGVSSGAPSSGAPSSGAPAKPAPTDSKPADARPAAARPKPKASRDDAAPRPGLADTVWLKDGSRVRGTVLRVETDNYVVLLGAEGVRTIPWRAVARIETVSNVPAQNVPVAGSMGLGSSEVGSSESAVGGACCADELANDTGAPTGADAFASASLGWDLRAEGVSLFKHYTVGGRGAWYAGEGVGGGASLSVHFRGPAWLTSGTAARWAELELGMSDSLHYVSWREGAPLQTTFLENQASFIVGAHLASGHWGSDGDSPWAGVVFGVAWLPTYVRLFGSDDFGSSGKFHPAGVRLTVDWGRIALGSKGLLPGLRASLTWLPYVDNLPTAVSVGLGTVFY